MKQILMTGVGAYLPETILTNDDLSKFVDTDDNWIRQRTGIISRRKASLWKRLILQMRPRRTMC